MPDTTTPSAPAAVKPAGVVEEPAAGPLQPSPAAGGSLTPMELLSRAVAQGADIAVLEKLMELQERWERNQARKAFDEAVSAARATIPTIRKNKHVGFASKDTTKARTDYMHETLDEIAKTINPILAAHGLSYRFRTEQLDGGSIRVTCILAHRAGHAEENSLMGGRDETGNKNNLQAVGSTVTYLQRYTLKAALGLAAATDDDAKSAGEADEPINDAQRQRLKAMLDEAGGDIAKFCEYAQVDSFADIRQSQFDDLVKMVKAKAAQKTPKTSTEKAA
jgi:hypothetical protein